jgi:CDP-glucose 4,6-dehydratase|tara:strand:- start:253 stop:1215 length:963 start_codon:yes stop_codon:yes gene_type:complete
MRHNILITGGFGLLGKPLTLKLINLKHNVFILEKKNTKRLKFLSKKPKKIIAGNFINKNLVAKIIKENNIDVVFHLGAITQVLDSLKKPYETHLTNIIGTVNFLENIRTINKKIIFIYSSSDKAYGELKNKKEYKEGDSLDSTYPYDVSKSSSDLICQSYSKTYSMKVGIIRCANIYGPGDFNLKRLIPEVILSTIENKNFVIRSDGKSTRDYVFVEDVVEAYLKLFRKLKSSKDNLKIYNVSSKFNYSVLEIVKMILKKMNNTKLMPIILNNSKQELNFQRLNYSKIQRQLGWRPKTDIGKGIKETINWYVKFYNFLKK